jgi:hypothetical protein
MKIEYTCEDGSRTVAKWPSMALQHWLGRSRPIRLPETPKPFVLYSVGPPIPSDDDEIFLTLVYAEVERRWNKTPPFDMEPPDRKKKYGGDQDQRRCLGILEWLQAEGDISTLRVSEDS